MLCFLDCWGRISPGDTTTFLLGQVSPGDTMNFQPVGGKGRELHTQFGDGNPSSELLSVYLRCAAADGNLLCQWRRFSPLEFYSEQRKNRGHWVQDSHCCYGSISKISDVREDETVLSREYETEIANGVVRWCVGARKIDELSGEY